MTRANQHTTKRAPPFTHPLKRLCIRQLLTFNTDMRLFLLAIALLAQLTAAPCPPDTFHAADTCSPVTECMQTQYTRASATHTSDTVCADPCVPSVSYATQPATATTDVQCTRYTVCLGSAIELTPSTTSTDRICSDASSTYNNHGLNAINPDLQALQNITVFNGGLVFVGLTVTMITMPRLEYLTAGLGTTGTPMLTGVSFPRLAFAEGKVSVDGTTTDTKNINIDNNLLQFALFPALTWVGLTLHVGNYGMKLNNVLTAVDFSSLQFVGTSFQVRAT